MVRAYLVVSAMAIPLLWSPLMRADDGQVKPEAVKKGQAIPAKPAEVKSGAAPSPEQLKGMLGDALKRVQSEAEKAAKAERSLEEPNPASFAMRFSKELQADVVRAIGQAQAKVGDLPGARASWQSAIDAVAEIPSFEVSAERAPILVQIAEAQFQAGDKDEARFTLRQASQSVRSIKAEPGFPPPLDIGFADGSQAKKADLLNRIARVHAQMGEKTAADDASRQALETAESIANPRKRIRALLKIAQQGRGEGVQPIWNKVLELALQMKDEYARSNALDVVVRARIKADRVDAALGTIADRLKGDAQTYMLWVVADAVASSDHPVASQVMDRLYQLAMKAEFDRPSKKIKVFQRIAEAQARLGDYDGAYRSAGEPHPINDIQNARAAQARIKVMMAVAAAQIQAKQLGAARETVLAAMEIIAPLPDEDAEAYFPLARLGELQAEAGDLAGALRTADALSLSWSKVPIFAKVAVAYARDGHREDAQKAIRRGFAAAGRSSNDSLWQLLSQADAGFGHDQDPMFPVNEDSMYPVSQVLVKAQAQIGDLDGSLKAVGEMTTSAFVMYYRSQTVDQIVSGRLESGDVSGALRVIDVIPQSDVLFQDKKPGLLERVARQQAEKGDPAAILEWAGKQTTPRAKLQLLRGLADGIAARSAAKAKESKPADPGAQTKPGDR